MGGIGHLLKCSLLKIFIPDTKTGSIPEQDLALVAPLVEIDKQMAAQGIVSHKTRCEHAEFVKAAPHIRRLGINKYFDRGGKCQHKPTARTAERTVLKVAGSTPKGIRKVRYPLSPAR
jgi:hypothetical protein